MSVAEVDAPPLREPLLEPQAYLHPVTHVELRETHISWVFLAGPYAYKVKKPVQLGFLDFGTLEKRRAACHEELRLNRRLAPHVYLDIVPVTLDPGGIRMDGDGPVIDWAVRMTRLPEAATFEHRLEQLEKRDFAHLAQRLAAFHAETDRGEHVSAYATFAHIAEVVRENFHSVRETAEAILPRAVLERAERAVEGALLRHQALIEERAARGVPRDTHGDLRLEHIYALPDRRPPEDLVILDCVEFSPRFRYADPVADIAFLTMDLRGHGRPDLAEAFADAWFEAYHDTTGRPLLRFYESYRAAVRAKVAGLRLHEPQLGLDGWERALASARRHWMLALGAAEPPASAPGLVLVGGLPGTGKSTVAKGLAEAAGFTVIRSDAVRKELAGMEPTGGHSPGWQRGIYDPAFSARTYEACARRAADILFQGGRVLIDATFGRDLDRMVFVNLAREWGVPLTYIELHCSPRETRARLDSRRGDISDADWTVYLNARRSFEATRMATERVRAVVPSDGNPDDVLRRALLALERRGQWSNSPDSGGSS